MRVLTSTAATPSAKRRSPPPALGARLILPCHIVSSAHLALLTPITRSVGSGHVDMSRLLLAAGADVDAITNDGSTPLAAACEKGLYSLAQLLLEHGAEVDRAVADGASAIVLAAAAGRLSCVRALLDAGADADRLFEGRPALEWARLHSHRLCVALLEGPVVGKAVAASATFPPAAPRAAGAGARVSEVLADAGTEAVPPAVPPAPVTEPEDASAKKARGRHGSAAAAVAGSAAAAADAAREAKQPREDKMADEPQIETGEAMIAVEHDTAGGDESSAGGHGSASAVSGDGVTGASPGALRDFSVVAEKRGVQREHLQLLGLSAGALVFSFLVMLFVRYGATGE